MKIKKAVITAASLEQSLLPLNMITDAHGKTCSVLGVSVQEAVSAGAEEVCIIVQPGSAEPYQAAVGDTLANLHFVNQTLQQGYGAAVYAAREFIDNAPFLHLVADHVFVGENGHSCASQVVSMAEANECSVSGVQATHESLLRHFGTVGGTKMLGESKVYKVNALREKPTPTEAEQYLMVSGLRAGYYLCFFGIHVLTPAIMPLLEDALNRDPTATVGLTPVLAELTSRERFLAVEVHGRRFPLDIPYGLLHAQLALALSGRDRDRVLTGLCELLAQSTASTH